MTENGQRIQRVFCLFLDDSTFLRYGLSPFEISPHTDTFPLQPPGDTYSHYESVPGHPH